MIESVVLTGLSHVLGQSAWARVRLRPFAGRHARLVMPPWQLGLVVSAGGLFEAVAADTAPDVEIVLPADAPLLALQGMERVMQSAHVAGNAEFATELAYVLKNLRWDVEEDLAQVVGDVAAHRIVAGATAIADQRGQAARKLAGDIAEYVAMENAIVINRKDLKPFADELSRLREDIERAERRVALLKD